MEPHCCDPAHAHYDALWTKLWERVHDAEARARWAEINESQIADTLARHYDAGCKIGP